MLWCGSHFIDFLDYCILACLPPSTPHFEISMFKSNIPSLKYPCSSSLPRIQSLIQGYKVYRQVFHWTMQHAEGEIRYRNIMERKFGTRRSSIWALEMLPSADDRGCFCSIENASEVDNWNKFLRYVNRNAFDGDLKCDIIQL
ncbi:hypothetical protein CEXT_8461 [Caerostris extrusa]|uniref:Uncharacterized protein n=1 Tax=Caerostris extrusa TaxID=172846 RepID=A0AAV4NDY6_CAEEX|nr:hypothetical protein CEXT_8461 [Caerostris extrusa]